MNEEAINEFTKTITIGNIVISTICYESFPCQHYCNLEGARYIYKQLENYRFINNESLTIEQKKYDKTF